jgi:hypothetical protein
MSGIDNFTKLMLHCNGSDESTTFTDDSASAHIPSVIGSAQIDTAQSVFGGASGLFEGSSDYLSIPTSTDFNPGAGDFTYDFRVRFNTLSGSQGFFGIETAPGSSYLYCAWEGGNKIRFRDFGGSGGDFSFAWSPVVDTFYHIAIVKSSGTVTCYVNGVALSGSGASGTYLDRTVPLFVASSFGGAYDLNGWIDEFRWSKGVARWTVNFTPPISEYSSGTDQESSDDLQITDSILVTDTMIIESEALQISDSITVIDTAIMESDNIQISDSIIVTDTNQDANFAYKILSINPLIFVTNTSPLEIVKVDTTDPINPSWQVKTVSGVNSAKDVALNKDGTYMYIAGDAGQVIKVEVADLANQTIIDVSDADDILTIEHNEAFGITYAGTDNAVGELYLIDERTTFEIDSDFTCLAPQTFKLETDFNIVSAFEIDSAFTALSYSFFKMGSAFNCFDYQPASPITTVDDVTPIDLQDCHIFIDDVELEDTDVVLSSVTITLGVGEESNATFQLTRKHDQLDTTLEGVGSVITNQNTVKITCKGKTLFPYNDIGTGRISDLDCQYQNETEFITVTAFAEEAFNKLNGITMSLPGLTSRLSLYDVLIQNPLIVNPFVDPLNEDDPKKYKGIRVDLGTKIQQSVSNWDIFDNNGSIADAIQDGTFNAMQNWTYFWSPTVTKFGNLDLGEINSIRFLYIGTSLSPVSEDLWDLNFARHWRQRTFDDIETALGTYEVGEAPFKNVSVRNGEKITKPKLTDETNGLYSIKDAGYNFIEYAKDVADLEYELLKNINGDILPDTSCVFGLTLDSYLYYDIGLLTRINVDNTTTNSIYNKTNGFPVSVKSITISLSDRKVSIDADNTKSEAELEIINSQYPDEDSDEYNEEETRTLIAVKTDMKTRLEVE